MALPLVVIPSRARPTRQIAARQMEAAEIRYVIARTDSDESVYPDGMDQISFNVSDIMTKRQAILEHFGALYHKHIVVDDDVRFKEHIGGGSTVDMSPPVLRECIAHMDDLLEKYPIVALADRFRIHDKPAVGNTKKMQNVVGFNTLLFPDPWPRYRVRVFEDLDMTLQLLSAGLDNALIAGRFTYTQGRNANGGCNVWRNEEVLAEANKALCDLWPGIVRRNGKDTNVAIQWQKCLKEGIKRRG